MPTFVETEVDVDALSLDAHQYFPAGIDQTWTTGSLERLARAEGAWLDAVETEVQLDELIATQDCLSRDGLWTAYRGHPDFQRTRNPSIITFRRRLYVWDGHHRLVIRRARGYRSMVCTVLDADYR